MRNKDTGPEYRSFNHSLIYTKIQAERKSGRAGMLTYELMSVVRRPTLRHHPQLSLYSYPRICRSKSFNQASRDEEMGP